MVNWSSVYVELIPEIKNAVKGNIFLCILWALIGTVCLFLGLWFITLPAYAFSIWFFIIRNKPGKGLPYAIYGIIKDKQQENRYQTYDSGPDDEFNRYWLTLDVAATFSFSLNGIAGGLPGKIGEKRIKIPGWLYAKCKKDTEITFIYLADDSIRGYIENDLPVIFKNEPDWEMVEKNS